MARRVRELDDRTEHDSTATSPSDGNCDSVHQWPAAGSRMDKRPAVGAAIQRAHGRQTGARLACVTRTTADGVGAGALENNDRKSHYTDYQMIDSL